MNGRYRLDWNRATGQGVCTKVGEILEPSASHSGSQDDQHVHHPKLGQVDTGGDRFGAILRASGRLHALQSGDRFAASMRLRALGRAPVLQMSDPEAKEAERRRLEREFDRLFGID
jgi:hypothetical protein